MAKDPAFLFYDGDAARDVSHMNRLERGCYFDLIQAQRKFGHFTKEQAQKILGKDFDSCWDAVELILKKDDDRFYIEWVEESINKRKSHCDKQKERINTYWNNKKHSMDIPRNNHGKSVDLPLENENENTSINLSSSKEGCGEKTKSHELIDYWQSKENLTLHRTITPGMVKCAKEVCSTYPTETLKEALDNYNQVMGSQPDTFYGQYKHGFEDFFRKGSGKPPPFQKFLSERDPLTNLRKKEVIAYAKPDRHSREFTENIEF